MGKVTKSISIEKEIVEEIDKKRGLIPFSPFVSFTLISALKKSEDDSADDKAK